MNVDRMVIGFAGTMVLVSLALAQFHSRWWLWLTVFVGANLLQSAFTGFCPAARVFGMMGARPGAAFAGKPKDAQAGGLPAHDRD